MKKIILSIVLLFFTILSFAQDFILPGNNGQPVVSPAVTRRNDNFTDSFINPEMVYVAGGSYTMGCTSEQGYDCSDSEKPAHKVEVNSFYIGKYEVTQAQWRAVMGNNPSDYTGDNLPVEKVSWNDVQKFIRELNRMQNQYVYRLPSEEEWEYAARGGNKSYHYEYSGSNYAGSVAWYGKNSGLKTHPVGMKSPNELGIYDMSGNVWEWCSSCSSRDYDASTNCVYRVLRGGGWGDGAEGCRVSCRFHYSPDSISSNIGFRLALSHSINFEMVYVAGGSYTMGCTSEQGYDCSDSEKPVHKVEVNSFYIGKYEVTQAQWRAVMGNNPGSSYFPGDNLPVERVSWNDVQEFIQKLNRMQNQYTYRLPSEEEWEYAARGGDKNHYKYSGSNNVEDVAWYKENSGRETHPVGMKNPNELGIYDMSGNVSEWCSSCSSRDYDASTNCVYRVLRGGNWHDGAELCRVSYRNIDSPNNHNNALVGFRLVRIISACMD